MKISSLFAVALVFPVYDHGAALAANPLPTAEGAWGALRSLDYRYFVAGGTCAAFSHGITTPIDVVKTRIQAEPEKYDKGMRQAALDIIKTDGPGALLGGLGPTVVGYGVEGAMKFGVYEVMKPIFASLLSHGDDGSNKAVAFLLASVVAGAVAALLLCPMESTRIKMVTDPIYAKDNLLSALARLAATEGLGNSFGGLLAMLSKQVPYTFGKQVSFDVFAGFLYAFFGGLNLSDGTVKWAVSVSAAAGASLVACILSQPGDMILTATYRPKKIDIEPVVEAFKVPAEPTPDGDDLTETSSMASMAKTVGTESVLDAPSTTGNAENNNVATSSIGRQSSAEVSTTAFSEQTGVAQQQQPSEAISYAQTQEAAAKVSTAFTDVVARLYRDGGVAKFFTGTQARIIHVGLIITSQLVVYDIVKQLLGLPATGSH